MTQFNDFMTQLDLSALNEYIAAHGKTVFYPKGDEIVQRGCLCRHMGIVKSGYFKYVALNSKGDDVVTGFSFTGEVVTDYVRAFLYDKASITAIVAGCDAEVCMVSIAGARRYIRGRHPAFVADTSSGLLQEAYHRYLDCLVKTPAERYHILATRYPDIIQNIPVQEIASYLGISRRHLQRIRMAGADE